MGGGVRSRLWHEPQHRHFLAWALASQFRRIFAFCCSLALEASICCDETFGVHPWDLLWESYFHDTNVLDELLSELLSLLGQRSYLQYILPLASELRSIYYRRYLLIFALLSSVPRTDLPRIYYANLTRNRRSLLHGELTPSLKLKNNYTIRPFERAICELPEDFKQKILQNMRAPKREICKMVEILSRKVRLCSKYRAEHLHFAPEFELTVGTWRTEVR